LLPPVPWRDTEELREAAALFLHQHHPAGEVPVPIEEIVEFALDLEIRPIRALRDRFGIEGSLSVDLRTIVADEHLMVHHPNRYRFTLAHEVGHLVLHSEHVRALARESPAGWKVAAQSIAPADYGRMEFQAYEFAGCVLAPRQPLLALYQQAQRRAEERGIDLAALQDTSLEIIAG
jgi:hypothetical protein